MPKCQWSIAHLKKYMTAKHGAGEVTELFYAIQSLMVRSLLAVQNTIIQDKHCFELYGYDVMFDEALDPWLIEVNASPSLSADTPTDRALKVQMVKDAMDIVDMEDQREGDEVQVGGFDLVWSAGPICVTPAGTTGGDRNDQKKKVWQQTQKARGRSKDLTVSDGGSGGGGGAAQSMVFPPPTGVSFLGCSVAALEPVSFSALPGRGRGARPAT